VGGTLALFLASWPVAAFAQPADDASAARPKETETNRTIIPFLEGTDVFWTVQRGTDGDSIFPNKLEADIFPHLVGSQNFTDVLDIEKQAQRGTSKFKEFAYSISGTPAVRIRMLRETSAPVRTPSYMPRVNFQGFWVRGLKDCRPENPDRNTIGCGELPIGFVPQQSVETVETLLRALPRLSLWEAHVIAGHHSNGQDGCLNKLQSRVPPETGPCTPSATVTPESMNRINGSFSTNYVRVGLNYSRNWMSVGDTHFQAIREARGRVEFEYHPRALVDEEMADLYGRARLLLGGAYAAKDVRWCKRRLEASAGLVWNPGVIDPRLDFSTSAQVSCFPTENGGWGLFARISRGQDYYNVGFLDHVTRVHIGATFSQTGFFRFAKPPKEPTP
jgi:hypothetical protein